MTTGPVNKTPAPNTEDNLPKLAPSSMKIAAKHTAKTAEDYLKDIPFSPREGLIREAEYLSRKALES